MTGPAQDFSLAGPGRYVPRFLRAGPDSPARRFTTLEKPYCEHTSDDMGSHKFKFHNKAVILNVAIILKLSMIAFYQSKISFRFFIVVTFVNLAIKLVQSKKASHLSLYGKNRWKNNGRKKSEFVTDSTFSCYMVEGQNFGRRGNRP